MWLELTDAVSGAPILVNTAWVSHWTPVEGGTLFEMSYVWTEEPKEARTVQVKQPYGRIYQALRQYQKEPGATATLHVRRRARKVEG